MDWTRLEQLAKCAAESELSDFLGLYGVVPEHLRD